MNDEQKAGMKELLGTIAVTWKGAAISAGVTAGFFTLINETTPVTVEEIAKHFNYDADKVQKWFYFAEKFIPQITKAQV